MEIPLFPLNVVLFPGMRLPLHIFEERYKLMLRRCLDNESPFGVVLIASGEEVGEPAEPAAIGTTAYITNVVELEEGRFNIQTEGRERFRIDDELHRYPYIMAEVTPLPSETGENDGRLAGEVGALFEDYCKTALALTGQYVRSLRFPDDPAVLADFIGPRLSSGNVEKQQILEMPSVAGKLEMERDLLRVEGRAMSARLRSAQTQRWWGLASTN
jgi:uncharacterized protein